MFTTTSQDILFFTIVCFRDWEEQREQLMASLRGRDNFDAVNTKEYFRWQKFSEIFRNQNFSNNLDNKSLNIYQTHFQARFWRPIQVLEQKEWSVSCEKWLIFKVLKTDFILCAFYTIWYYVYRSSVQIISDHNRIHPTFLIMNEYSMMKNVPSNKCFFGFCFKIDDVHLE